jgi:hypothetical protein
MNNDEFLTKAKHYIEQCEQGYFTGVFSEDAIKNDLQNRKARDQYSTLGSNPRQTDHLSEKKRFYFKDFDARQEDFDFIIKELQSINKNHALIPKCERCKNQVAKLRNLVRNF